MFRLAILANVGTLAFVGAGCSTDVSTAVAPAAIVAGQSPADGNFDQGNTVNQSVGPRFRLEVPSALTLEVRDWSPVGSPRKLAVVATYADGGHEDVTGFATYSESDSSVGPDYKLVDIGPQGDVSYRFAGNATVTASLVGLITQPVAVSASHASPSNPAVNFESTSGARAYVDSGLTCTASGASDPEGTPVRYVFEWTGITGTPIRRTASDGSVTETYLVERADRGNKIQCVVAAEDGAEDTLRSHFVAGGAAVQVYDRAPNVPYVTLSQVIGTEFRVGGRVRCEAKGSIDADGDPIKFEIRWNGTHGGQFIREANGIETYTLTQSDISSPITCEARAVSDISGEIALASDWSRAGRGMQLSTDPLAPIITSMTFVHLSPSPGSLTGDRVCNSTVGVPIPWNNTTNSPVSAVVDPAPCNAEPGDVLLCTATGFDPSGLAVKWGLTSGETLTRTWRFIVSKEFRGAPVTCVAQLENSLGLKSSIVVKSYNVNNRPPQTPTVAIGATSPLVVSGTQLSCNSTTSDPDGDTPLLSKILWTDIAGSVDSSMPNNYTVVDSDTGPITCSASMCDIFPFSTISACQLARPDAYAQQGLWACCGGISPLASASISLGNNAKPNAPLVNSFASALSTTVGSSKLTAIWTSGDGATPPVATQDYLIVLGPPSSNWTPADGITYTAGQSLFGGVKVLYAGAGVAGNTIGGAAGTLGFQGDYPFGRYKYSIFARGTNGRYSSASAQSTGEVTAGVTITVVGPTPTFARAGRDTPYWDLIYDGATSITLSSANLTAVTVSGNATGTLSVSTLNATTRRVTLSNITGTGSFRFGVAAGTGLSPSGNALAVPNTAVTTLPVEAANIPPTDPVVTLTHQDGVLTCAATSSDANNDPIMLSRKWKRDGVIVSGRMSLTYKIALDDANTSLTCEVYASDGMTLSGTVSSSSYSVGPFCQSFSALTAPDAILGDPYSAYDAATNPYLLCNASQVSGIADGCTRSLTGVETTTHCAKSFKLAQNIDMSAVTWTNKQIGSIDFVLGSPSGGPAFSGTLDGGGLAIRGLTITRTQDPSGYTDDCSAFISNLSGTLKNIALERFSVTNSIGPAAATVCAKTSTAKVNFANVRASAFVQGLERAGAMGRWPGAATPDQYGQDIDFSGIVVSTSNNAAWYGTGKFGGVGPYMGESDKNVSVDRLTAWVNAYGRFSPALPSGSNSMLLGTGFTPFVQNATDGSHTTLLDRYNPVADLSTYPSPATAPALRQLAVTSQLFYNPYDGKPIVKYNQGSIYDTSHPGYASGSCIRVGGVNYNSRTMRSVAGNVFSAINHPVFHGVENGFGQESASNATECNSPYAVYPRTPFADAEALPVAFAQAKAQATYTGRGFDFTNVWDIDDSLPYLRTTTFPISFFNATVEDTSTANLTATIKSTMSFTKTATQKVDTVRIYLRPRSSSPRMISSCATTNDRLLQEVSVTGAGSVTATNTVQLASWSNFPFDVWLCGYKNGAVTIDGMYVQGELRPEMVRPVTISSSDRLKFRVNLASTVSATFDELHLVEGVQNASSSALPTYCGASGSNKVVATVNVNTQATNEYVDVFRSLNSPQALSPGNKVSYLLCGKMKSSFLTANPWANQGAGQPASMTPMFMFKDVQLPAAPVLSNITANPSSPSFATTTTIRASFNMDGTARLYGDASCSNQLTAGDVTKATFEGAGVSINVAANATTPIHYVSKATDGTQSLCVKIMDFVTNTNVPSVNFSAPAASFTKSTAVNVPFTFSNADVYNIVTPSSAYATVVATGNASATSVTLANSAGNWTATVNGPSGDGTLAVKIIAGAVTTTAGLANPDTTSQTFQVDNTPPVITGSSSFALGAATALDTAASDSGSGINTSDPTAIVWSEPNGTTGLVSLSSWTTIAPTFSATTAGTYALRVTVRDRAGNVATKDVSVIWNTQKPIITITGPTPTVNNGTAFTYSLVYANYTNIDNVNQLNSQLQVNTTNGLVYTGAVVQNSAGNYTVTLSPSGQQPAVNGTVSFSLPAGTARNSAGVLADAASSGNASVDMLAPTFDLTASYVASSLTTIAATSVSDVAYPGTNGTVSGSGVTSYAWSVDSAPAGGSVTFGSASAASTTVSANLDGNYVLRLRVTDAAGNFRDKTTTLTWASTVPTVSISGPVYQPGGSAASYAKNGQTVRYTLTFSAGVTVNLSSGNVGTYIQVNSAGGATGTAAVSGTGSTRYVDLSSLSNNGTLSISVLAGAAQNAGGVQSALTGPSTTFKVDNSVPTVAINNLSGNIASAVNATSTASDPDLVAGTVSGSGVASYAWSTVSTPAGGSITFSNASGSSTTVTPSMDGSYTVRLNVTDNAGNVGTTTASFTYSTVGASVSIGTPTANGTTVTGPVTGSPTIVFPVTYTIAPSSFTTGDVTVTTSGTVTAMPMVGGSGTNRTVTLSGVSGSGTVSITIRAGTSQSAGGVPDGGAGPSTAVTIDNTAPVFAGGGGGSSSTTGGGAQAYTVEAAGPTTIGVTATDSETSITYAWTNRTPAVGTITFTPSNTASTSVSASAAGTYTLRLTATNAVGLSSYIEYTFTWNPAAPSITIGNGSPAVTRTTSVSWAVTYANASPTSAASLQGYITVNRKTAAGVACSAGSAGCPAGTLGVTGSGSSYTVTLSSISGDGSLGFTIASGSATNNGVSAPSASSDWVTVDNTNPSVGAGTNFAAGGQTALSGTATDSPGSGIASVQWAKVSGTGTLTFGYSQWPVSGQPSITLAQVLASTVSASAEATYSISLTATDVAGNTATSTVQMIWSTTAATVSIESITPATIKTGTVTMVLAYSGAATYSLNATHITLNKTGSITTGTIGVAQQASPNTNKWNVTIPVTAGNGQFTVTVASGTAANAGGTQAAGVGPSSAVKVDNTGPTVTVASIGTITGSVNISATATDPDLNASPQVTGVGGMTYLWTKVSGPGTVTFGSSTALSSTMSVSSDGTYTIRMTATDALGNTGSADATFTKTVAVPATPSGFTATGQAGAISLTWTNDAAASTYTLSRANQLAGPYTQIWSGAYSVPYSDSGLVGGNQYFYKLDASNAGGSNTSGAFANAYAFTALTTPTALTTTAGNNAVSLTWGSSTGGDPNATLYYQVLRSTANTDPNSSLSGWTVLNSTVTATSYTDSTAANGTNYYYSVRAMRTINSSYATPEYGRAGPPSVPVVTATGNLGNIMLSWPASSSLGAVTYTVSRSNLSNGVYTDLSVNQTTTSFVNSGLADNTTWYYKVTATNSLGTSAASTVASATTQTVQPAVWGVATGSFTSSSHVIAWNSSTTNYGSYFAYSGFNGGVRVAMGDVNGDGKGDIITAPGVGGGPNLKVFVQVENPLPSPPTISESQSWFGGVTTYTGGLYVASCDVNNDGVSDVIRGVGTGGGGYVVVYLSAANGTGVLLDGTAGFDSHYAFQPFPTEPGNERRVGCGDFDGDGYADIIVSQQYAAASQGWAEVWRWNGSGFTYVRSIQHSYYGAYVAGGDYDGNGKADAIISADYYPAASGGSTIKVLADGGAGASLAQFAPFGSTWEGGNLVSPVDWDGDGRLDLAIGADASGGAILRLQKASDGTAAQWYAYGAAPPSHYTGGVSVGGGYKSGYAAGYLKPQLLTVGGQNGSDAGGTSAPHTNSQTPTITGTAIAGSVIKLYIDSEGVGATLNKGFISSTSSWNTTPASALADGDHYVIARAAFGNTLSTASTKQWFFIDRTVPSAPVVLNGKSNFNTSFQVTLQTIPLPDTYFTHFRYTTDGTSPTCTTGTLLNSTTGYDVTIPAATTTLKAVACDKAGNVSAVTSATYTYDASAPAAPNVTPANGWINAAITITIQNGVADASFKEFRYTTSGVNPTCTTGTVLTPATSTTAVTVTTSAATTDFRVIGCDLAGNASTAASRYYTYDGTAPNVSSVTLTTPSGAGTSGAGVNLDFTVSTSESVTVSGTPRLNFTIGGVAKIANYVSGSGSAALIFRYGTVADDLGTVSLSGATLALNGGTMRDDALNNLSLSFTGAVTSRSIDAKAPTISSISISAGYSPVSTALDFTVTMSESVTVTGTPTLPITIGGVSKSASYVSGTGTSSLTFRYTTVAGDNGTVATVSPIGVTSATIADSMSNAATLTFTGASTSRIVDTTAPLAPSISPAGGWITASTSATISQNATTDTNFKEFRYTTNGVDPTCSTGTAGASVSIPAATTNLRAMSCDQADNGSAVTSVTYTYDATAPTVQSATLTSPTGGGSVGAGVALDFTVSTSEVVTVTGAPTLTFLIGATSKTAALYNYTAPTNGIVFRYTTVSGDSGQISTVGGTLALNGGTMRDAAGNNLTLTFTGAASTKSVSATSPVISSVSLTSPSGAGTSSSGVNLDFTVTTSTAITYTAGNGAASLPITIGGVSRSAAYSSGSGSTSLVFRYTTAAGDNGLVATVSPISLTGNSKLRDSNNNNLTLTFTSANTTRTIDTNAPTTPTVALGGSGAAGIGANLDFTITWNESVTVAGIGSPTMPITIGGASRTATYNSGSPGSGLVFRYTVASGDNGTIATVSPVSLGTATIKDAGGNNATLTFAGGNTTRSADTTAPNAPNLTANQTFTSSMTAVISQNGSDTGFKEFRYALDSVSTLNCTTTATAVVVSTAQPTNVNITGTTPMRAITCDTALNASAETARSYTLQTLGVATPVMDKGLSWAGGLCSDHSTIVLSTATAGATIKYSLTGSAPTTVYTVGTPITLTYSTAMSNFRAIAEKSGMTTSSELTGSYLWSTGTNPRKHLSRTYFSRPGTDGGFPAGSQVTFRVRGNSASTAPATTDNGKEFTYTHVDSAYNYHKWSPYGTATADSAWCREDLRYNIDVVTPPSGYTCYAGYKSGNAGPSFTPRKISDDTNNVGGIDQSWQYVKCYPFNVNASRVETRFEDLYPDSAGGWENTSGPNLGRIGSDGDFNDLNICMAMNGQTTGNNFYIGRDAGTGLQFIQAKVAGTLEVYWYEDTACSQHPFKVVLTRNGVDTEFAAVASVVNLGGPKDHGGRGSDPWRLLLAGLAILCLILAREVVGRGRVQGKALGLRFNAIYTLAVVIFATASLLNQSTVYGVLGQQTVGGDTGGGPTTQPIRITGVEVNDKIKVVMENPEGGTCHSYGAARFIDSAYPRKAPLVSGCGIYDTYLQMAPSNLTVGSPTATTLNLSWNAVSGATSYTVSYSTSPDMSWPNAIDTMSTSTSYVLSGLSSSTTYYVTVAANNASRGGTGPSSAVKNGTTLDQTWTLTVTVNGMPNTETIYVSKNLNGVTSMASWVGGYSFQTTMVDGGFYSVTPNGDSTPSGYTCSEVSGNVYGNTSVSLDCSLISVGSTTTGTMSGGASMGGTTTGSFCYAVDYCCDGTAYTSSCSSQAAGCYSNDYTCGGGDPVPSFMGM